jgi:hypothetical protein
LIAKTGREAAKRGLDFEPQVNTEINRVLAGKPKHKSSTGLRGKVARAAGEHIVSYAKKKNMGVTSAERTPVNYRRADIKLKASDRDVAMVSLKIMQRQRNGDVFSSEVISACKKFDLLYPKNLNILLKRTVKYDTDGRYENYEQALEMDTRINAVLIDNNIVYQEFDPTKKEKILDYVVSNIE